MPSSPRYPIRAAVCVSISAMARALVQTSNRRGWRACTARRMFSEIGRVGNRLVIWNERPMPARQMRSGGRPEMSSAPSRIVPASGGNMPETRLKAVVLPAPLGPISACSVRSRTENVTPSTALMPPKCFTIPSALSTGPSRCDAGFRKSGSGASPILRPAMAAASTTVLRNGASTRPATPTSPVGENRMKPTNSRPNHNSQFSLIPDR